MLEAIPLLVSTAIFGHLLRVVVPLLLKEHCIMIDQILLDMTILVRESVTVSVV